MNILAIDQGSRSGFDWLNHASVLMSSHTSGVTEDQAGIDAAVRIFGTDARFIVVFEDHSGMRFSRGNVSSAGLLGLGAARGRWEAALDRIGHPQRARIKVKPQTWRRAVLGLGNVKSEVAKHTAVMRAAAELGRPITAIDDNEAEAVCIALWAERAPEARELWQRVYEPRRARKGAA